MRTEHSQEDPLVELGYETRDADLKVLGKASAFFFGFIFFSFIIGFGIFWWLNPDARNEKAAGPPFAKYGPPSPSPLLQTNITAKTDIKQLRMAETTALTTSAVIDRQKGIYRIPIDRAIDLIAQRGLPERPGAANVTEVK
jgi:hypothetical protein